MYMKSNYIKKTPKLSMYLWYTAVNVSLVSMLDMKTDQ